MVIKMIKEKIKSLFIKDIDLKFILANDFDYYTFTKSVRSPVLTNGQLEDLIIKELKDVGFNLDENKIAVIVEYRGKKGKDTIEYIRPSTYWICNTAGFDMLESKVCKYLNSKNFKYTFTKQELYNYEWENFLA